MTVQASRLHCVLLGNWEMRRQKGFLTRLCRAFPKPRQHAIDGIGGGPKITRQRQNKARRALALMIEVDVAAMFAGQSPGGRQAEAATAACLAPRVERVEDMF